MRKSLTFLIVAGPLIAALVGFFLVGGDDDAPPLNIPATGPLTIALTGDVLLTGPLGRVQRDPGFVAVRDAVRAAHFAAANLEMNLLGAEEAIRADARPAPRWPYGSALVAGALRQFGFDAISLANDHAGDYGPDAMASTIRVLDRTGLLHAGTGFDLAQARAPVFAGPPGTGAGSAPPASKGRVAFISVATSSMPDARATLRRGEIAGRPGVSPLRYTADITVDAATFQTLKDSLSALQAGPPAGVGSLTMFGTPIKKGDQTAVEFIVDQEDERALLDEITAARAAAEVVIVSVHSHEPANASEEPAGFMRRFSRAAIDAGASLVVGHGPHRLRGIEVYGGGAILYSLGNFLYQTSQLDFRAANSFDAGADLYQASVGALGATPPIATTPPADPAWWEGVLVVARFEQGRLNEIRLLPLSLGGDKPQEERGMPRMATGEQAAQVLERLGRLSGPGAPPIHSEGGIGIVRVNPPIP